MRLPFPLVCAYIGIGLTSVIIARGGWEKFAASGHGWLDTTAFILFLFLLAWLLTGRRSSLEGADAHEDTRKLVSFRLGKAFKRALRYRTARR